MPFFFYADDRNVRRAIRRTKFAPGRRAKFVSTNRAGSVRNLQKYWHAQSPLNKYKLRPRTLESNVENTNKNRSMVNKIIMTCYHVELWNIYNTTARRRSYVSLYTYIIIHTAHRGLISTDWITLVVNGGSFTLFRRQSLISIVYQKPTAAAAVEWFAGTCTTFL